MDKLQVLFPEPTMGKLRAVSKMEDRPMSEIVRRATESWLDSRPEQPPSAEKKPKLRTFRMHMKVTDPKRIKEIIYDRDL